MIGTLCLLLSLLINLLALESITWLHAAVFTETKNTISTSHK